MSASFPSALRALCSHWRARCLPAALVLLVAASPAAASQATSSPVAPRPSPAAEASRTAQPANAVAPRKQPGSVKHKTGNFAADSGVSSSFFALPRKRSRGLGSLWICHRDGGP